jgi:citrate synthase
MFAIPRVVGWLGQWVEMLEDADQRIARPRQVYTGDKSRQYVPMDKRG